MKAVLALALLVVAVSANVNQHLSAVGRVRGADPEWHRFVRFVRQYERTYASVREVNAKFDIFRDNMKIAADNQRRNPKARFGVTQFADISQDEFRRTYLLSKESAESWKAWTKANRPHTHHHAKKNVTIGDVDWCAKGVCSPIKDQEQCGSCWAFSATETLESMVAMQSGSPPVLAPQQIVDCDKGGSDQGCQGGMPAGAIDYLVQAGGQEGEDDYPYTGADGSCNFDQSKVKATPKGSTPVGQGDDSLQAAIQQSVVSVGVDASQWSSYQGGIMTDCGSQLDHAVVATGMSSSEGGYYIVRNSWNAGWGENGFIFLAANGDVCGVADNAITVQV
jgi:C1A family cysteine protease